MLQAVPRRRLGFRGSFRAVTKHVDVDRQVRRLAESLDLASVRNPKVDLNYFTLSVPMGLSEEEKQERLAEMSDTVIAIEGSDVMLLGIWVSRSAA